MTTTMKKKIQTLAKKLGVKFTDETSGDAVIYLDAPEGFKFQSTLETSLVYGLEDDRAESLAYALADLKMGLIPA